MKILVVFTGGTIGSTRNGNVISPDCDCVYTLLDMYNKSNDDVDFTTVCPYNILSENLDFDNLNSLYKCISSYASDAFDGVIVTHGTDTLQYTSAFLGYAFSYSKKPIVLVSANFPLEDKRTNGFINFSAAVDFIRLNGGKGAFVAYTNRGEKPKIHRATRLIAHLSYSDMVYSAFDSFYGEISDRNFILNDRYKELDGNFIFKKIMLKNAPNVIKLNSYVFMHYPDISEKTKAVLIEGYHSGTLNTKSEELAAFCRKADELSVPIFLTGACEGFNYESKLLYDKLKIEVLPPASPVAMYMKLCLLDKKSIEDVFLPCANDFVVEL